MELRESGQYNTMMNRAGLASLLNAYSWIAKIREVQMSQDHNEVYIESFFTFRKLFWWSVYNMMFVGSVTTAVLFEVYVMGKHL